jgi:hypothetical protein
MQGSVSNPALKDRAKVTSTLRVVTPRKRSYKLHRSSFWVFLLIASLATLSCQSYTTGLQQSGGRANEVVTLANTAAISRAQTAYNLSNPNEYGTFEQLAAGGYLDGRFNQSKPKFYGYIFTLNVNPKSGSSDASYTLNADPDPELKAAGRHFYVDSTSPEIRVNPTQPASASDDTLKP